jgi:hypothetical protein
MAIVVSGYHEQNNFVDWNLLRRGRRFELYCPDSTQSTDVLKKLHNW